MKSILAIFTLTLCSSYSFAQQHRIDLSDTDGSYYTSLVYLEKGPTQWFDKSQGEVRGSAWRVGIVISESNSVIIIEQITYGIEGCCAKVVSAKKLDMDMLWKKLGLRGEQTGVEFAAWMSADSFVLRLQGCGYQVKSIQNEQVVVFKVSG